MKSKNIFFLSLMLFIFLLIGISFINNILWLFSEHSSYGAQTIQNRWDFVLFSVAIFSTFLIFTIFKFRKFNWQSSSIYIAFFIALFTEMFGFPLTIYFISSFTMLPKIHVVPITLFDLEIFGARIAADYNSILAGVVTIVGLFFVAFGWKQIYKMKGNLTTKSLYSIVRHPQYFGILLMASTWLVAWPTIPTLLMWPVLVVIYYRLAKTEENFMEKKFGKKYIEYKKKVPMLIPFSK